MILKLNNVQFVLIFSSSLSTPTADPTLLNEARKLKYLKALPSTDGTYSCQFCSKTFPRLGYLKKHEQVRNGFRKSDIIVIFITFRELRAIIVRQNLKAKARIPRET